VTEVGLLSGLLCLGAGLPFVAGQVEHSAAGAHFAQAQEFLRQGNSDSALSEVQAGLKLDSRSVEGLDLLGIIYVQKRDYDRAIEALDLAAKIDPHRAQTLNSLANCYLAQNNLRLAEKEFRETLRYHPADRDANYNLGIILLNRKDPRQAILYFSHVHPQDSAVLLNLAQAYFADGQNSKALEAARSLSGREKSDVRTHFTLGILLAGQKLYVDAIREFELADALQPETFEILHDLGEAWLKSGDYAKAEEILQRARVRKPDSADTLYLLAQAGAQQGKTVQALELLVEAHKLAPENTDIIFLLARMSMQQNYYEDAARLLEEGIKLAPRRADLHSALGECYFVDGKIDAARQEFQTLIDLDPSAPSYAFMGLSYRHQGQFDEARKSFNEGLKRDPRNAVCLFNLGYMEHKEGHYAEAEGYLARALAASPNYNDALYEMAGVKMSEKKYAEAVPLLQRAAKLLPHPGEAYYKLATAERNLHQTEAAQRDMRIFETLSKDPRPEPYPLQDLFQSVSRRVELPAPARAQADIQELQAEAQRHPDRPNNFYLLAEAYLKLGRADEALQAVAQVDQASGGDARTATGTGVLLARYGRYAEAIQHFRMALAADPGSEEAEFDLANAYFSSRSYSQALDALQQIGAEGQKDDAYLSLLADVDQHLGHFDEASKLYGQALKKNPDNDDYALSYALAELQSGATAEAESTLRNGLARTPDSGRLTWGLGIVSVTEGKNQEAGKYFNRTIDLLPEWQTGYSSLGVFYYQTGQIDRAREILDRYSTLFPHGVLDVDRIRQVLASKTEYSASTVPRKLSPQERRQVVQILTAMLEN
jgi:tetratricopeptide (TPR) repeat protein